MKNKQSIGNIHNSKLDNVNVNNQTIGDISNNNMLEENTCKQSKAINFLSKNTVLLLILLGVSVAFWVLAIVAYKIFGFFVDANNIVLTFVGIIATFIVISHYTQINNIEHKVDEKLSLINEINTKIKTLEKDIIGHF